MTKVWFLLLFQLAIIPGIVLIFKKFGLLNFSSILLLSVYCITFPISGISHFLTKSSLFRGYFDLAKYDQTNLPFETTLLSLVIEIALIIGVILSRNISILEKDLRLPIHRSSKIVNLLLLGLIPISFFALSIVTEFIDRSATKRVLFLDGGLARYFFISIWIVWPIIFFALYLLHTTRVRERTTRQFLLILVSAVLLFSALNWTGSRLLTLLFVAILILNSPQLSLKLRRSIVLFSPLVFVLYVYGTTMNRIEAFSYGKNSFSISGLLDWQVGRFSILGATLKFNADEGILQGSTLVGSITQSISGVARLVGISIFDKIEPNLSVSQEFGVVVFSDPNNRYLAPGLIIEVYRNFGLSGLVLVSLATPVIVRWFYVRSRRNYDLFSNVIFTYFTIVFVFVVFLSSSESLIAYFFYYPFPLFLILFVNRIRTTRDTRYER
jgi:hypothetical protein